MSLRINLRRSTVEYYLEMLAATGLRAARLGISGVVLERPMQVHELPGFETARIAMPRLAVPLFLAQQSQADADIGPAVGVLVFDPAKDDVAIEASVLGFTAARQEIVTLLRNRSRPYRFSNSLPPPVRMTKKYCWSTRPWKSWPWRTRFAPKS